MAIQWKFKSVSPPLKKPRTLLAILVGLLVLVQFSAPYIGYTVPQWLSWVEGLAALGLFAVAVMDLKISPEESGMLTGVVAAIAAFSALGVISITSPLVEAIVVLAAVGMIVLELHSLQA